MRQLRRTCMLASSVIIAVVVTRIQHKYLRNHRKAFLGLESSPRLCGQCIVQVNPLKMRIKDQVQPSRCGFFECVLEFMVKVMVMAETSYSCCMVSLLSPCWRKLGFYLRFFKEVNTLKHKLKGEAKFGITKVKSSRSWGATLILCISPQKKSLRWTSQGFYFFRARNFPLSLWLMHPRSYDT